MVNLAHQCRFRMYFGHLMNLEPSCVSQYSDSIFLLLLLCVDLCRIACVCLPTSVRPLLAQTAGVVFTVFTLPASLPGLMGCRPNVCWPDRTRRSAAPLFLPQTADMACSSSVKLCVCGELCWNSRFMFGDRGIHPRNCLNFFALLSCSFRLGRLLPIAIWGSISRFLPVVWMSGTPSPQSPLHLCPPMAPSPFWIEHTANSAAFAVNENVCLPHSDWTPVKNPFQSCYSVFVAVV